MSVRRGCQCVGLSRAAYYRSPLEWSVQDAEVIDVLNALVESSPRWGFWKYFDRIRALGHEWNHKRVYRVYRALGLNQPRRTKRRLPDRDRVPLLVPQRANQVWSADFMSDALYQGPRFR
jgi:putative transposase